MTVQVTTWTTATIFLVTPQFFFLEDEASGFWKGHTHTHTRLINDKGKIKSRNAVCQPIKASWSPQERVAVSKRSATGLSISTSCEKKQMRMLFSWSATRRVETENVSLACSPMPWNASIGSGHCDRLWESIFAFVLKKVGGMARLSSSNNTRVKCLDSRLQTIAAG